MLKKKELIDSVIKGISDANDCYEKITNGLSIDDSGVEGVFQTKIAESIFDMLPKDKNKSICEESIILEYPFKEIFEQSGAGKTRGRIPQLVSGAKRVDIMIINSDENPIIPIEVKRNAATEGFAHDANRIMGVLARSDSLSGGSVKFGLICRFIFGKGNSKAECLEEIEHKRQKFLEYLTEKTKIEKADFYYDLDKPKNFEDPLWWVGGAICVYLRRN